MLFRSAVVAYQLLDPQSPTRVETLVMPNGWPPVGRRESDGSDRRLHRRFPAFSVSRLYHTAKEPEIGFVVDISWSGCRVACSSQLQPEMVLGMSVVLPTHGVPLLVPQAVVRWTRDPMYGLEFVYLQSEAKQQLRQFLHMAELELPEI